MVSLSPRIAIDVDIATLVIDDPARLQHVVDQHQATPAQPREDLVVVRRIRGLVGVDEREVELLLARQRAQRLDRGPDLELDALGDLGTLPRVAGDGRPLLTHVAAQELAADAEAARDGERRVPGERADFDGPLRAHRAHDHLHEDGLVVTDLHDRAIAGLLARDLLQLDLMAVGPGRVGGRVLVDRGIGESAASACFHGGHSTTACDNGRCEPTRG